MKSTSLIISAAVCFNLMQVQAENENYSLWPRRPEELQQARQLLRENKVAEALELLAPFVSAKGIVGREARQICSLVNRARYLSPEHPNMYTYTVQSGDSMEKIALKSECPMDVIMLLNGVTDPSSLRSGQRLRLIKMQLSVQISPEYRELTVWDGDKLVAMFDIISIDNLPSDIAPETTVQERAGGVHGRRVARRAPYYPSSDRTLELENGMVITAETRAQQAVVRLAQKDVNELAMLLHTGAVVRIVQPSAGE